MREYPRYVPAGDEGISIEHGNEISPEVATAVRRSMLALQRVAPAWLVEVVPSYRSLLVVYDPEKAQAGTVLRDLQAIEAAAGKSEFPAQTVLRIPVCYGGEYGPDLGDVSSHTGLSPEEVIALHSSPAYLVYMIGFTIGFPYLGGMSPRLATPRLASPRTRIPAGSVGIAGQQTGIYSVDSPGGWRLIGRTPLKLADPTTDPPCLLAAGDYVRFVPVGPEEYLDILEQVEAGRYSPVRETVGMEGATAVGSGS
ncbi:MAG: 5-oxoprolinase subunit PxpB [Firmicutes bacterium]|nr:5-oxoprolinase subunit PxpB [Bacillota bacterium]